ncbi:MAG: FecCD family ABC transporter permease [Acidimicrobiia bacterium]
MARVQSPMHVAGLGLVLTVLVAFVALSVGTVPISPVETLRILAERALGASLETSPVADPIVWNIRLPRILAAAGAGAALGLSGTLLQGLFRNKAADPQLVGLSAIGSVGVLVGLLAGWALWGPVAGVIGGAIVGVAGAGIIRALNRHSAGDPSRFILTGIGFGVSVGAIVAAASIAIHDPRIPDVSFWFFGGLAASTWGTAMWTIVIALVGFAVVYPMRHDLDVLSLGSSSAQHVGLNVGFVTALSLAIAGLITGAAVGAAGVVAFVGLTAAQLARVVAGNHHRNTLIASAFVGASFLIAADMVGRLVGGRFEVPVGLVTAVVGGPFLVWLITTGRVHR